MIGPSVWKSTSKGVAHPAPRSRWKASKLFRDALSGGRFSTFGGPVSRASAGAESSSRGNVVSSTAAMGLRDTRSERRTHGFCPVLDHSCQRLTLVPSAARPAGIANRAVTTASTQATTTPERR